MYTTNPEYKKLVEKYNKRNSDIDKRRKKVKAVSKK
jgi:hypothetical protein|tara:strand:+ start:1531 stop:1638 length:108 start_codon:yes stop_codon:yes gene_type:complete